MTKCQINIKLTNLNSALYEFKIKLCITLQKSKVNHVNLCLYNLSTLYLHNLVSNNHSVTTSGLCFFFFLHYSVPFVFPLHGTITPSSIIKWHWEIFWLSWKRNKKKNIVWYDVMWCDVMCQFCMVHFTDGRLNYINKLLPSLKSESGQSVTLLRPRPYSGHIPYSD